MVESTRFELIRLESSFVQSIRLTGKAICKTLRKKTHKKANREGRKSGRIDSIRLESTGIVRCVVDSTNWKVDLQDT